MENFNKKQIVDLEIKLLTAMKESDYKSLNELLHEKLLFVIPTGQTVSKKIDVANHQSGNLKINELDSTDQEISFIDDCAVVSVTLDLKGNFLQEDISGTYKYLRVWKFTNDQWRVIGGSGMKIE